MTARRLSCLYFGNQILWTTTGIRKQDLEFPDYDLLDEINTCELGILLKRFRRGLVRTSSIDEFRSFFEQFCKRYNAHPSYSMGAFPFEAHWGDCRNLGGWTLYVATKSLLRHLRLRTGIDD